MASKKRQAASGKQQARSRKSRKGLSRWGLPKRPVVMWDTPWPISAETRRLLLARQKLGAELEDLEFALEARMAALADDGSFVRREGKILQWYARWRQRLDEKFRNAEQRFLASYAEDEKAAKSGAVVSIVRPRRVAMGLKPTGRKR